MMTFISVLVCRALDPLVSDRDLLPDCSGEPSLASMNGEAISRSIAFEGRLEINVAEAELIKSCLMVWKGLLGRLVVFEKSCLHVHRPALGGLLNSL